MAGFGKDILVIGMSHIECLRQAMTDEEKRRYHFVNLNRSRIYRLGRPKAVLFRYLALSRPKLVVLSIDGNAHNIVGLIENPVTFAVGSADNGLVPDGGKRRFIPRDMMRLHLETAHERTTFTLNQLASHFRGTAKYHILAPPPTANRQRITKQPGVFQSKIHLGLAPDRLRMDIYRLQCDIYADICGKLDIALLEPPEAALDRRGLLARGFIGNATHGNRAYGRLVLDQINAVADTVID